MTIGSVRLEPFKSDTETELRDSEYSIGAVLVNLIRDLPARFVLKRNRQIMTIHSKD